MAFVGILTETMTNVLCPILMQQFHVETATVQWLTTGYLLMVSVVITVSSFFNKRFTINHVLYCDHIVRDRPHSCRALREFSRC